jgi:hypothetical protein
MMAVLFVLERAGKDPKSDTRAHGNNPRFPWEPSTTMLTYRLAGARDNPGATRTNQSMVAW